MYAIGLAPISQQRAAVPVKISDTEYVITFPPDNLVMSVQPGGSVQTRPAGTVGAWERCTLSPDMKLATFAPTDEAGNVIAIYVFALTEHIPNVNG